MASRATKAPSAKAQALADLFLAWQIFVGDDGSLAALVGTLVSDPTARLALAVAASKRPPSLDNTALLRLLASDPSVGVARIAAVALDRAGTVSRPEEGRST